MAVLPIKTSPEDAASLINYLKTKATGAQLAEAKATLGGTLLDGRKLSAYEQWGLVSREGDRLKLTERGRDLSRASEEGQRGIYRDILRSIGPYRMAIEWLFHQSIHSVTHVEVAAHWHDHVPDQLGTSNEHTIRDQALCFFGLAEAAGLGTYKLGRGGNPTRLEASVDALGQFVGESGLVEDDQDYAEDELPNERLPSTPDEIPPGRSVDETREEERPPAGLPATPALESTRVFISHSKNMDIVDQVKTMLEYANLDFEVAEEEETTAIPVPDKVFGAMRRCTSAVICVTTDDQLKNENGDYGINQNVLIEIGAAFVLYDKKVLLVWDRRLRVPSNLQGLYRCEFEGNELSWGTGMKFMKGVNNFKKSERPSP